MRTTTGSRANSQYDKVCQSVKEQNQQQKHGPITGSDLGRNMSNGLIRACDWSMLSTFAFAL